MDRPGFTLPARTRLTVYTAEAKSGMCGTVPEAKIGRPTCALREPFGGASQAGFLEIKVNTIVAVPVFAIEHGS